MPKRKSVSSGYSSSKRLKFSDNRDDENNNHFMLSQVLPNPVLSKSLRLGGTRAINQDRKDRINRSKDKKRKVEDAPETGSIIQNRYRVDKLLGKGSFGFVCSCTDLLASNLKVAIKFLKYIDDDKTTLNEISILNRISDADLYDISNTIRLIDLFKDGARNQECLVFPMYSSNLYDFMKKNHFYPFNLKETQMISKQLLEAIKFINSLHIIHTDLKPENIMLVDDSYKYCKRGEDKYKKLLNLRIKIIDFGMSVEGSVHKHHCQTRHYRAPEIILEQEWSYGVDLWSVGCIVFELITGETIFMPKDTKEHLFLIDHFLSGLSKSVINRCDKEVRKRFFHKDYRLRKVDYKTDNKPLKYYYKYNKFTKVINLIEKLLECNFKSRISAYEALMHDFFVNRY